MIGCCVYGIFVVSQAYTAIFGSDSSFPAKLFVGIGRKQHISCWNEFSFALVLIQNVHLQTVPLALTQFKGQFGSDYPLQMTAMLITMSPIVILYFVFSNQIIKGMVAGAVKG